MASETVVQPSAAADLMPTLQLAGDALLTAQTMAESIGYLVHELLHDSPCAKEYGFLTAVEACLEKLEAAVVPAQEKTNELTRQLNQRAGS